MEASSHKEHDQGSLSHFLCGCSDLDGARKHLMKIMKDLLSIFNNSVSYIKNPIKVIITSIANNSVSLLSLQMNELYI